MKRVFRNVIRHVWAYLAVVFVFAILWNSVFAYLTRVPASQKVTVFIASRSEAFPGSETLQQNRPAGLRAVEVRCAVPDTMYFDVYLSIWGYTQADILILPETLLDAASAADRFSPVSPAVEQRLGALGSWDADGTAYGLRVYDSASRTALISGIEWGEGGEAPDYYLLFRRGSAHLGDLPGAADAAGDDAAIRVAEILLTLCR